MEKDFDTWNEVKKQTNERTRVPFFHEREVWWCSLGLNVGFEQDGTGRRFDRPVVILRCFNSNIFFGVALTGKKRFGKYYLYLGKVDGRDSSAILSQVRLIDARRLVKKIGMLHEDIFLNLKKDLQKILFS